VVEITRSLTAPNKLIKLIISEFDVDIR
jgi:hypothetical protein